ncbi:hypothetical protein O988_01595, partial [Pseudogymnoascus sp. VKM F-3808]
MRALSSSTVTSPAHTETMSSIGDKFSLSNSNSPSSTASA